MNNVTGNDIVSYVIRPITRMLDGQLSDVPLDYKVGKKYIEKLRKENRWEEVEEMQWLNRYTVRGMVDYCRNMGYEKELSMSLTPLYLELLTIPHERMYFKVDTPDMDEPLLRRQEATYHLQQIMSTEAHFEPLFARIAPLPLLEGCIEVAEKKAVGNYHWSLYLRALAYAAHNGVEMDWDALYEKVKPELVHRPANCIKTKVAYCCLTIAVVMIMRDKQLEKAERERLLRQVAERNAWIYTLFDFYSVLLNLPLNTNFPNVIQIVNRFITDTNRMPYTHLIKECLHCNPHLLEVPKGSKKWENRQEMKKNLQAALKSAQSDALDGLFKVLFPKAQMSEYSQDSTRLTTGEIQKRNMALVKQINEMQVEISTLSAFREAAEQYGDSVPIIDLREMLNRIDDPEKAQLLFMNLDFHLSENESWRKHRKELKGVITEKFEAKRERERLLLEAASKPTTQNYNFEKGSCNFGAGSSMFGNVHMNEKSNNQTDKVNESDE